MNVLQVIRHYRAIYAMVAIIGWQPIVLHAPLLDLTVLNVQMLVHVLPVLLAILEPLVILVMLGIKV